MTPKKDPLYAIIKYDKDIKSNWYGGYEKFDGQTVKLTPKYRGKHHREAEKINLEWAYYIENSEHFVWDHEFVKIEDKLGRLLYE